MMRLQKRQVYCSWCRRMLPMLDKTTSEPGCRLLTGQPRGRAWSMQARQQWWNQDRAANQRLAVALLRLLRSKID